LRGETGSEGRGEFRARLDRPRPLASCEFSQSLSTFAQWLSSLDGRAGPLHKQGLVPLERVERTIFILRGRRVILDSDLAALYGVTVKRLSEQVKRNVGRFPDDFAFVLTKEESESLRSQFATLDRGRGEHRKLERKIATHDQNIVNLFDAVRSLMTVPEKSRRQIGFETKGKSRGQPPST
jgi:hypothetical protein